MEHHVSVLFSIDFNPNKFLPDLYSQDDDRIGLKPASVLAGEVLTATCEGHTAAQYQLFRILPRYV